MSVPTCFEKTKAFLESVGRSLPIEELRNVAKALSEKQAQTLSTADFEALAEQLLTDVFERRAAATRTARILQLQKIQQVTEIVGQKIEGSNLAQNTEGWILGNTRRIGDAMNVAVADIKKGLTSTLLRSVRTTLNEVSGDLKVAESGLLSREITQDMSALERGASQSESGNEQAWRIAKVYNGVLAQVFEIKQAFDPFLGKIQDYFFRATHDRVKVTGDGSPEAKIEWVNFALSKYGDKSFPELDFQSKVEAFGNIYDQIRRGVYESALELDGKPGDIFNKLAKSRTLIPNDWQAFADYNEKFGRLNVHTTVLRTLETAAHDVAVIQKFGSNPADTFNGVMRNLLKNASPEEADLLRANQEKLQGFFKAAVQPAQGAPAVGGWTRFFRGFMAVEQLAKNGSSFLRSWTDLANFARRITDDVGGSYLGNFVEAANAYAKHFGSNFEARQAAMEDMFLYSRSALHNLYQELGGSSGVTGTQGPLSKGLNTVLELHSNISLMNRHISSVDAAMASVLSRRLGQLTQMEFSALPKEAVQGLLRYGIKEAEWKLLQQGVESWANLPGMEKAAGDVSRMLNVDSIMSIPNQTISQYLIDSGKWKGAVVPTEAITRARTELASQIGAMVNQHADAASSTAGLSERLWMYGNTIPGTFTGEGLRLIAQFKSAMVKNYDTMMRSRFSNPEKLQGDWSKVVQQVILASGLWASGETAKGLLEGRTPPDLTDPKNATMFFGQALLGSGASGLVSDSILTELTRHENAYDISQGIVKGLAGPVVNTGADVLGLLGQLGYSGIDSKQKAPGPVLGRLITSNLPFQNLFYTKAAFNYYFANGIKEWMSPGYLGRLNRNMVQKGEQPVGIPVIAPPAGGSAF